MSEMFIVCGWCGKQMGTKPCDLPNVGKVSHSICANCQKKVREKLKEDKRKKSPPSGGNQTEGSA